MVSVVSFPRLLQQILHNTKTDQIQTWYRPNIELVQSWYKAGAKQAYNKPSSGRVKCKFSIDYTYSKMQYLFSHYLCQKASIEDNFLNKLVMNCMMERRMTIFIGQSQRCIHRRHATWRYATRRRTTKRRTTVRLYKKIVIQKTETPSYHYNEVMPSEFTDVAAYGL